MGRWIRRLLLTAVVIVVLFILGRNTIGVWIVEGKLKKATGFSTNIEFLNIKLTQPRLMAREITITNPKDLCNEPRAMKIDLLEVDYKPASIFQRKPHFEKLVIDISEVVAVKNTRGELNLRRLQCQKSEADEKTATSDIQIDELVLSLGTVLYIDERREGARPVVYHIQAKNRAYRNIQHKDEIKSLVMNLVIQSVPANILGLSREAIDQSIQSITDAVDGKGKGMLDFFLKTRQDQ